MPLFANIVDGHVSRVIVADSIEWPQTHLGGEWVETVMDSPGEQYAGIGMGLDPDHPMKFAPQWVQPVPGQGDGGSGFPVGSYAWHNGRIWQSTSPNNVWEPGEFGWRDRTDQIPPWRQPAGAGDEWHEGDEVLHNGKHWRSKHAANVWEPGVDDLWDDITETEPADDGPPEWKPWSGVNEDLYQEGDRVTHQSVVWVSIVANNHWEPGIFGWDQE